MATKKTKKAGQVAEADHMEAPSEQAPQGSNMQKSVSRKGPEPLQYAFWERFHDGPSSQTIDLLDLAPRFVLYTDTDARVGGKYLSVINREFVHGGRLYTLQIHPARVMRNGSEIEEYPGVREQLVEEVIRHIAVQRGRLTHGDGDIVRMKFSIHEIREELKRTNHTFSYYEVIEALTILHRSALSISSAVKIPGERDAKVTFNGSIFPEFIAADRERSSEAVLQFNSMFAKALRHLEFRPISYEMIMRLSNPMSRWLYKKLNHLGLFEVGPQQAFDINATDIMRDCGLTSRARMTRSFAKVTDAVAELKEQGVLADYDASVVREGKKHTDVGYTLVVSDQFRHELMASHRNADEALRLFQTLTGSEPNEFVPATADAREAVRTLRKRQTAALAKPAD